MAASFCIEHGARGMGKDLFAVRRESGGRDAEEKGGEFAFLFLFLSLCATR
jgi:hypothetical protein